MHTELPGGRLLLFWKLCNEMPPVPVGATRNLLFIHNKGIPLRILVQRSRSSGRLRQASKARSYQFEAAFFFGQVPVEEAQQELLLLAQALSPIVQVFGIVL